MIAFLSPARNMAVAPDCGYEPQKPLFLEQTAELAGELKTLQAWEFEALLELSPALALEVFARYQDFDPSRPGTPALLSYKGLAYQYLDAQSFTPEQMAYAHEHLRVMSAFYGMLRPLDGIQPYRLGMDRKLKIAGQTLYQFWGDRIYHGLFDAGEIVVNLASAEYSQMVTPFLQRCDRMVTCKFVRRRRQKLLAFPSYSKMARGKMARFIVEKRIEDPEQLKEFDLNGYFYTEAHSTPNHYICIGEN